jgi:hypothetical protein
LFYFTAWVHLREKAAITMAVEGAGKNDADLRE